jgi:hypothetical protein
VAMLRPLTFVAALLAGIVLPGCSGKEERGGGGAARADRIRVNSGGSVVFDLKAEGTGFAIEDKDGKKVGSVKVESDRVKVADADGKPAFKVKKKDAGFKLYREPAQAGGADVELANYSPDDVGFRIKDASDKELYRGKKKGEEYEVTGPEKKQYVIKNLRDGIEVEDQFGQRLVRLKGLGSVPAAIFITAPEYDTLQKAAVTAYAAGVK